MSGAVQLIEVFRNTLGLTLQLSQLLTLFGLVFSLFDLLAKFFVNDDVEVTQGNKDNNQNHNGQSNRWDSQLVKVHKSIRPARLLFNLHAKAQNQDNDVRKIRERIQRPDQRLFKAHSWFLVKEQPVQNGADWGHIVQDKIVELKDAIYKNLAVVKQEVSYQASYRNAQHKRVFNRWHPWLLSGLGMLVSLEQRAPEIGNKQHVRDVGEVVQERNAEVHSEDARRITQHKGANHSNKQLKNK